MPLQRLAGWFSWSLQQSTGAMCQLLNVQEPKHNCKLNAMKNCSGIRVQVSPLVGALSTEICRPLLQQRTGKGDGAALLTVPVRILQTLLLICLSQEGLG